jgi:cytidylate kinase
VETIIISGMPAVGKTTVSRLVAADLSMKTIGGGEVLKEMAVEEGYTPGGEDWWDTGEGMKFLQKRKRSPNFDKEVDQRLLDKARKGNVVITSYTLPWLSRNGVKVWLSGSVESRARRMARRDQTDEEACRDVLAVRDRENYKLYRKMYEIEFGKDLSAFDLVIETDSIDESKVAAVILHYVKNRPGA